MPGHCKNCKFLRTKLVQGQDGPTKHYHCDWRPAVVAWAYVAPSVQDWISPRHVVPGNDYMPDADGSTQDWTEKMNCPMWEQRP